MTGLFLAWLHHILFMGLVVMLSSQMALLRVAPLPYARLSKLDIGYGISAAALLIIGAIRVVWGEKGWAFYADNHFFWAKMALFLLVGIASIRPSLNYIRWRKELRSNPQYVPEARELTLTRTLVVNQIVLLVFVAICAAGMARWPV